MNQQYTRTSFFVAWSTIFFLSIPLIAQEPFAELLGPLKTGAVAKGGVVDVPYILWGGDVATFLANGDLKTKPTSIFKQSGLDIQLVNWLDVEGLEQDFSSAGFAALRSQFKAIPPKDQDDLKSTIRDFMQPAIKQTRRYQTLQALINCTRRSLLPDPNISEKDRALMEDEIRLLEQQGIR